MHLRQRLRCALHSTHDFGVHACAGMNASWGMVSSMVMPEWTGRHLSRCLKVFVSGTEMIGSITHTVPGAPHGEHTLKGFVDASQSLSQVSRCKQMISRETLETATEMLQMPPKLSRSGSQMGNY